MKKLYETDFMLGLKDVTFSIKLFSFSVRAAEENLTD